MPNKDKIRKVYDLMNEHYDMGTPEEFEEQMNDAGNREIVFKTLQKHYRLDNAPDQYAFDDLMGYGLNAGAQAEQPQQPAQYQAQQVQNSGVDAATGVSEQTAQPQQYQKPQQATQRPQQKAPGNYVEQGAQNLPTYYETATGAARPQYGTQPVQQAYNVAAPETNEEIEENYVKPGYVNGEGFGVADRNYGQFAFGQHMSGMQNDVERMKQGWEAQATAARAQKSLGEEARRASGQQRFEAANARGMAEAAGRLEAQKYGQKVVDLLSGTVHDIVSRMTNERQQVAANAMMPQYNQFGVATNPIPAKMTLDPKEVVSQTMNAIDTDKLNELINEYYGKDFGELNDEEKARITKELQEYAWQALGKEYQTKDAMTYIAGSMYTNNMLSRLGQAISSRSVLDEMAQKEYGKSYSELAEQDEMKRNEISMRMYGKALDELEEEEQQRVREYASRSEDLKSEKLQNELDSHTTWGMFKQGQNQYAASLQNMGWKGTVVNNVAGFYTLAADAVPFMLAGGIASQFSRFVTSRMLQQGLAGIGGLLERQHAAQAILNSVKTQAINATISSGLNFGLYDFANAGIESYAAGNLSWGDMLKKGAIGTAKGSVLGLTNTAFRWFGGKYTDKMAGRKGVAARVGMSVGSFGTEVMEFAMMDHLEKNGFTLQDFDWSSVGGNAVLIGLMKMKDHGGDVTDVVKRWKSPVAEETNSALTMEDVNKLVEKGYGKKSKSVEEWCKSIISMTVDARTGESSRKSDLEAATVDDAVPLEIRRKLLFGQGIVTPEAVAWSVSDPVLEDVDGYGTKKWTVRSFTENSQIISSREFNTEKEAKAFAQTVKNSQVKNHIMTMEKIAGNWQKALMESVYELSKENGLPLRQVLNEYNAALQGKGTQMSEAIMNELHQRAEGKVTSQHDQIIAEARKQASWDETVEAALEKEPEQWTQEEREKVENYRSILRKVNDENSLDWRSVLMNRVTTADGKVTKAVDADGNECILGSKGVIVKENGELDLEAMKANGTGGAVLVYDQNGQNPRWIKVSELSQWQVAPSDEVRDTLMKTYDNMYGPQIGNIVTLRNRYRRGDMIEEEEKQYKVIYVGDDGVVKVETMDGSGEEETTAARIASDWIAQQQREAANQRNNQWLDRKEEEKRKSTVPMGFAGGENPVKEKIEAEQPVAPAPVPAAPAVAEAPAEKEAPKPTYVPAAPMPVDENLPEGHIAEVGTKLQYHDPNTDELKNGTYAGPSTTRPGRHRIVDERGNLLRNRDGSAMEVDEMDIVLPEKAVQAPAAPVAEAPAPENVNGGGTDAMVAPENVKGAGMPLNAKGKPDPIGNGVTPERALQYLEQERGMEPDVVKELIDGQVKKAGEDIAKYAKKKPDASKMDPDDYIDAYEQWKKGGMALREVENRWKAIADAITAREEAVKAEQRAREEAIRKQMAAEEQARIDAIREQQRKETEERERKHREFMAELERKRQEQEALEAEQANEELTGDEMAEQAVMEEQQRRERMRITDRLTEVGRLTDLDHPADAAMAAQVAYLQGLKITPESLRLELGSNFGKFGREGMLRLADNNGRSIAEIADSIAENAGLDANGQPRLNSNDVRSELINCIREGSASAIEALEKRVGIGTERAEDRPEYWTEEKIAEYEARQQQNQQMTEVQQQIAAASEEVNTSPTDAQKEAGNYKKGHVKLDGMEISIEQPKGSTRSGVDADGLPWSVRMNNTYGYIRGTKGKDKDHIDIYLSDNPEEGSVFVVDQIDPRTGEFDEHKVMYGFNSLEEAREAYLSNYMSDWQGLGNITEVNKTAFKVWLSESVHKTKPFADYRLVKAEQAKMGLERPYEAGRDPFSADRTGEFLNGNEGMPQTLDEAPFSKGNEPYTENVTPEHKMATNTLMTALKGTKIPVAMAEPETVAAMMKESGVEKMAKQKKIIIDTLDKAAKYINDHISDRSGIKEINIPLSPWVKNKIRQILGHDVDGHVLSIGGLRHGLNGHGGSRKALAENEVAFDESTLEIAPYVMACPDRIEPGTNDHFRKSVRYIKNLPDGSVFYVESEYDLEGKTLASQDFWIDKPDSAKVVNANSPEHTSETVTLSMESIAKIKKDAEIAIEKELERQRLAEEMKKNAQNGKSDLQILRSSDMKIYGWVKDGKIYLTADGINPNTPIHEYSHLWAESVKKNAPKLWENVKSLMKQTDMWKDVLGDELYEDIHGDEDRMASEVLSRLSGRRGAEKLTEMAKTWMAEHPEASIDEKAAHLSIIARMKQAIKDVWNWVGKELFGIEKFGSAEEVADRTLYDLMNGTDLKLDEISDSKTEFSIRKKEEPKKKGIGYKVFYRNPKDGKLYPPMVANPNGADTPVGVWLDADAAPIVGQTKTGRNQVKAGGKGTQGGSGQLAYRPGWHLGEIPYALQFGRLNPETGKKDLFPKDFVWAEVEYAADKDYQEEAYQAGINANGKYQHSLAGLPHLPEDGYYRYRTNPNPETDPWIITGAMKVNRVLSNDEVDDLVRKAGREPQKREPEGGVKVRMERMKQLAEGVEPTNAQFGRWAASDNGEGGVRYRDYEGENEQLVKASEEHMKAVENGDMETAQKLVNEAAKASGYTIHAYHGTNRADRVGTEFKPERATSGPMSFFTDNKGIADNYAKNKKDTSMAYDGDWDAGDYHTQFKVNVGGYAGEVRMENAWGYLPYELRNEITKKAMQVTTDDMGNIITEEGNTRGTGGYDWNLKQRRGNAIKALVDEWLDSGNLFNKEGQFMEVLEKAGVLEAFEKMGWKDARYLDPNYSEPKTYDTYLKIEKPFDTNEMYTEKFVDRLEKWWNRLSKKKQAELTKESMDADHWDKNSKTIEQWIEDARYDLAHGETWAWTVIPDALTEYLKSKGYDGIIDRGGKGGGTGHNVFIPFYPEQIKSAEAVTRDAEGKVIPLSERFDTSKKDIRFRMGDISDESHIDRLVNSAKEPLKAEEAQSFVNELRKEATVATEVELTPESYNEAFPGRKAQTPIGVIKLGEHQYEKLLKRKRQNQFGMMKETLENPDFVLFEKDEQENVERNGVLLFAKTFKKANGDEYTNFESVSARIEGDETVISNHIIEDKAMITKLTEDQMVYNRKAPSGNSSERRLAENSNGSSDLVPTRPEDAFRGSKDTDNQRNRQINRAEITETAEKMAENLNKKVKICQNADEISDESVKAAVKKAEAEGRTPTRKGWFNTRTGEIEVYAPAAENVEDVQKTVLHETVGHYGLRELLSDSEQDYNNAMVEMYRLMNDKQKKEVQKLMSDRKYDVATAMDEYLAKMAEDRGNMVEPTFWEKAKSVVKNLLRKIGIDVELTDGDLKYLLWSSHEALKNSREVTNADGSKSRVYERKTMDQKAADWAMRWHNDVLGLRSKWEAERNVKRSDVRDRDTDPDDDPTTPGGGGSTPPTGGRERSLEEMIDYDAQEFKREFERMKTENDQITLGARVREFIRNRMTPLAGKRMTASDINGLMRDVDYAITHKSKKGLERALNRMQTLIHQAEGLAQIEEMMKTLNTRTTTVDKKGMVKGVLVDEAANEVLNNIKSSYKQMLSTSYDERLSEVRREMRALKEQYGITRQDDPAAPEEFKTRMQELKEKQDALKAERDGVLSSQVEETIESLNTLEEDINNQIGNLAVNEDGDAVTPNATMLERLTQEKLTIEIRKKLAELRQMMSAKQEIQKELDRTGSPKERQRLEEEIDKMQRRINITSRGITEELKDIISEGRSRRAEFVKADMERQMRIVRMGCNAVRDKEVPDTLDKKNSRTNWQSVQGWFADKRDMLQAPIFSFNFMSKYIDHNNAQGDGEFYNYFMRGENGALKANNEYSKGVREFGEAVNEKCKELFGGKGIDKVKAEAAKLTDKKITKLVPDKSIPEEEWSEKHVRMTKGQMLYAWLTWRQEAGRTKMQADGWTKRSIEEMQEQLGPEMLELGRWMTDDFLKALRDDKYNVTYEKAMGTSMHKAAHYFPLRIDKLGVQEKSEVGQDGTINLLPSASSGNLIVRTTNRLPVDLSNDAFEVLEDYGRTMERWNAMAELTKDLNTLIKSQGFRNLMEANHEGLFQRWKDACAVATASYNTKTTDTDKALSTLHNGFMQQAIGYGFYTAIKQTLSAPAFWAYSWDPRYWKNMVWEGNALNAINNYKWAKENLPSFSERIAANDFGIEAINDKSVVDKLTRIYKEWGMKANKLVDAVTVANGARAVYEYDKGRFMKMKNEDGSRKYTDEQADELAKVNAQIVFNESQQSSRNEFSSPIQKQRGILQRSAVAFQNSNIGYRRMMVEGLEDIFSKNGNRSRGFAKVLTVGILNAAWYMGLNPALAYNKLTGKTDDEEDEKFWDGILSSVVLGYLSNGTILGPAMTAWTSEFGTYNPIQVFDLIDQKMDEAKKQYKKDDMGAMSWAIIDNILKFGGVNLEKFDGMYNAFYNAIKRGEWKADDTLSFLNMARTQRRELANHDLEDKTATEYMVDVMRADKKIEEGDRGRGWWNGDAYNKVLTDKKRTEIINDYVKKSVPDFEPVKKKLEAINPQITAKKEEIKKTMPKAKPGEGDAKERDALNQAIDEVLKDDPEMLKMYKRYVNSTAGRVEKKGKWENETYAEKHTRLTKALADAVKALEDSSGSYTRVDNAAMELIWLEDDILKAMK